MRNPISLSCSSLLLWTLCLLSTTFASGLFDCLFVYQEVQGGTEIPGVPTAVQEGTVPDCPPGTYDNETWPGDGCKMNCLDNAFICLAFGYVTSEKSVLHMSCGDQISGSTPDGSTVIDCEENAQWIDRIQEDINSTTTAAVTVRDYTCDSCKFESFCIPPFFQNYTGPLVTDVGTPAPSGNEQSSSSSSPSLQSSWFPPTTATSAVSGSLLFGFMFVGL